MLLLFTSVASYQNLECQILLLTYDVLSVSSHGQFYFECVLLNYASLVKLIPIC